MVKQLTPIEKPLNYRAVLPRVVLLASQIRRDGPTPRAETD
jgi:hypothetical protein